MKPEIDYPTVIYPTVTAVHDCGMDTRENRRLNLQALMDREFGAGTRGAQSRLAEKLDKAQSLISRYLAQPSKPGAKDIGEDFAREVEQRFEISRHSLDLDPRSFSLLLNAEGARYGGLADAGTALKEDHQARESNVIAADFSVKQERAGELSIPQFNVRGAMGAGQLANDYVEIIRHVTMDRAHLDMLGITFTSPANLAIITGWGQSMAGTINHGEPVFVDRGVSTFTGDGVYVFTWDDLVYIKRLQKESKTHFKVISDNRDHDPFMIPIAEVTVHARALLAWNARKL